MIIILLCLRPFACCHSFIWFCFSHSEMSLQADSFVVPNMGSGPTKAFAAPCFAKKSALMFPGMPECPLIQARVTLFWRPSWLSLPRQSQISLDRISQRDTDRITAMLSRRISIRFPVYSLLRFSIMHMIRAYISAWNMVAVFPREAYMYFLGLSPHTPEPVPEFVFDPSVYQIRYVDIFWVEDQLS